MAISEGICVMFVLDLQHQVTHEAECEGFRLFEN